MLLKFRRRLDGELFVFAQAQNLRCLPQLRGLREDPFGAVGYEGGETALIGAFATGHEAFTFAYSNGTHARSKGSMILKLLGCKDHMLRLERSLPARGGKYSWAVSQLIRGPESRGRSPFRMSLSL